MLSDDSYIIQSFLSEVGYCTSTLNLALNLLISYELTHERKERLKQQLLSNQTYNELANHSSTSRNHSSSSHNDEEQELNVIAHLHSLMQQIFYVEEEKITSWQVRVRIVELKHLVVGAPLGQLVYLVVEIGEKKFRTRDKQIDALDFDNDDEV